LLISILSKCFSCSNESNQKAIRDRSSKVETTDTDVIIKIDISNAFNTTDRALTLYVLGGRASRDYACGLKEGQAIFTGENLSNFFGYFKAMRTCHVRLRCFDWDRQVHLAKGKSAGQQGESLEKSLEKLIFNLTIHHLWRHVLAKHPQARALAYADDGCIKARMSVALQVLADLNKARPHGGCWT
jgi:hypothetical protein